MKPRPETASCDFCCREQIADFAQGPFRPWMSILHRGSQIITNIVLRLLYSFYKYLQFPRYSKIFLLV